MDCKKTISKNGERCVECSNERLKGTENNRRALGKRWKLKKPRGAWSAEALERKAKYMRRRWSDPEMKDRIGKKISVALTGRKLSKEHVAKMSGPNHYAWINDRGVARVNKRNNDDPEYHLWARAVKQRDRWTCKLKGDDCGGRLEAHHIYNWVDYPELRYRINNGITLCHAHHPKGRAKEKRLVPKFVGLVSVSKEPISLLAYQTCRSRSPSSST